MNRQLFELQDADNTLVRLRRERSKLDDGAAARSERDTMQKAVGEERERQQHLHTERLDRELALKSTEEKIARQNGRLMSATNAHEVEALQRDLKGLAKSRGDLDEAILILMDEQESGAVRLGDLDRQWKEKIKAAEAVEAHFDAETARIESEMAATQAQRESLATALDPEHLEKYESFARRYQGVAVAHPEKGMCSACGMVLTPFNLKEAKTKEWPTCESCNRLLFLG